MKLQPLLLLTPLFLFACTGQQWHTSAGPMFVAPRGQVQLQNATASLPLGQNSNYFDSNFGFDETQVVPHVRLESTIDRSHMRLNGFYLSNEGSGTLGGAFGDLTAGSVVSTKLNFYNVGANYAFQLLRGDHYRLGAGGALAYYELNVKARSSAGREEVDTSLLIPMPYAEAEVFTGPLTIGANLALASLGIGDGNGQYWDLEGYLKLQADERIDVTLGYRYLVLDAYGRATGRDFRADVDLQGIFLTAGVTF